MNLQLAALASSVSSAMDRLHQVPAELWWNLGSGILIAIAAVNLLRKIRQVNCVLLVAGSLIIVTSIAFNWIYERNEPAWATAAVQLVAGFFPGKGRV